MKLKNITITNQKLSMRYFFIPIVLIVFYFLFFLIYDDIKKRTINEFNNEQLILAQTAAQGITTFFEDYQSNLTFLSQFDAIIDFNDNGKTIMANFCENHKNLIAGLTRVDEKGVILFTYPINESVIGNDISSQKHVQQIIASHKPVLSDVFMSVQGYLAIALHVPIFKEKEYKGSLAMLIPIDKLGERYLGKTKIRGTGHVWLLSENGIEIYCPVHGHEGNSFLEITHHDSTAIKLIEKISNENSGTTESIHQEKIIGGNPLFIKKYVAFYRAPLGNTYWTILISYQEEDIYLALTRLRNRLIFVFALLFIIMSYYFYSLTKVRTILKEESKRKIAEKTLRENEEKFRTIFEESPIGIELYDKNGRQVNANAASLNMFGIPDVSEIKSFNIFDGTSLDRENKEKLKKGQSVSYQAKFDFDKVKELRQYKTSKSGKAYFDYTITPLLHQSNGEIEGYLVHVQDISERKRAEEEILMLAQSLKSVNECVSITDTENKIIFVNEAFLKTYGYNDNEVIGQHIVMLRSKDNDTAIIREISRATLSGGWKGELQNTRKDGSIFPIYLSTNLIKDKNGNHVGLIGVASDITERKQNERELIFAKEKAEESDRLKSAFLANMSHEIRTPMNGILGFAELLKEPELTGEEQKKYIAVIEKSGERMLNIINDIIDISKIEAGQVKLEMKDTDLNQLSEFLFNFFKPEMIKKELGFFLHLPDTNDHLIINTDKEKLYAILTNLLKNAVKYTKIGMVEFGFSVQQQSVEFYVKDSGIGIPKERLHAIFDRFVQADIEDKKAMEGAGLGLAISKAYAQLMGGQILVESETGQGSTFRLTIPFNKVVDQKPAAINTEEVNEEVNMEALQILKDVSVLIAEDEVTSDIYLTEILKSGCKEILHAATGAEAVEIFRKNQHIQLILMDIKMPLMDGYEASRMIRKFNKDAVIIAQTAFAFAGDREKAIEAGCNDYLSKPIKKSSLLDIIMKNFKR